MNLTDELAVERTRLANERTLLSYVRTGLAIAAGGVAVSELMTGSPAMTAAAALVITGIVTLAIGVWRYRLGQRELQETIRKHGHE